MNCDTKINEFLGAKKFKKFVFLIEKIKFKLFDRFYPLIQKMYENNLNKSLEKELKSIDNEDSRQKVIRLYHEKILNFRKAINDKKNLNYHINEDNPMEFLKYLNNNKKIHQKGLIGNGIVYILISLFIATGVISIGVIIGLFCYNVLSTIINFECINLQNYNIKIFNKNRDMLEKWRKKKEEEGLVKYSNISRVVYSAIDGEKDIPKVEDVVSKITTKEQLEEMRKLLLAYGDKDKCGIIPKKRVRGGKYGNN